MKINITIKRIIPVMLVMGILFAGFSTCVFAAGEEDLFAKHVSVSENVTELVRNMDGKTGANTTNGVFTDKSYLNYAPQDGYLQATNNYSGATMAIARFCVRLAQAKGTLPAYNKANKLIIESKMRIDAANETNDWINIGITNGLPYWDSSAVPLAGVKMVSADDKKMQVRLGGFKGATLTDNQILADVYPEGEFISYKITIDVPDGVSDTDTVPVSYEINGVKQDYKAQLAVSKLKAVYESTSPRIVYGTQEKYNNASAATELIFSVDDLIVTSVAGNLYSRMADFKSLTEFPSNYYITSTGTAVPVLDRANGVKFDVADKDQYVCFKSNGKYLSEYNKPFVAETRIKFDPFDNKGQLRIQARGRDSKNGTNAGNQQGTLTLMTFNRGSIVLRQNVNPSSTTPDSIKIGEFKEDTWYNVKLIFSITDEKMYAYVYTDDYSYETAGVTDIPLEKMYSYNLASLAEINSLGVFSGTSNGGRATSYVSDFKMYAADVEQGEIEYIEAQMPDSVKDAARVSFSDIVDLTKLNMTIQHNGEEYTDYKTQLEGDGSTLAIVPSAEWKAGSYTIKFNDTVKGYFGGECEVNDISFEFALNAVKEFTALSEYRYEGDNKGSFNYAAMPEYIDETAVADEAGFHFINLVDDKVAETPVEIWDVSVTDKIGSMQTFYYEINNVSLTNANGTPADKVGFYAIPWVRIDGQVYSGKAFTYGGSGFTESEKGKVVQETRTFE